MTAVLPPLPPGYAAHRAELRRVATHVLSRSRAEAVGRIGLVPTPGGIGTPAFGAEATVVRLTSEHLVVERGGDRATTPLAGSTLRVLADAAQVDLGRPLDAGADAPPVGDPDAPLAIDPAAVEIVAAWLHLGWEVLDRTVDRGRRDGLLTEATRLQLWPEHFDGATTATVGSGAGVQTNLGACPGDDGSEQPYLYVGPWDPARPGDPAFWNAPFGASLGYEELRTAPDPVGSGVAFLTAGLELLVGDAAP